jgi:uncharacterized protein (TIGR02996 family)
MTDREAFVAAIADTPRDDAPRLVYADWLDEHGEPERAAFIRLQCRAARLRPGTVERTDALRRADDLAAEHEADWLGDWASCLVTRDYHRGFLRRVRMTAEQFLEHGEQLFRAEPARRLELVKVPTGWTCDHGDPLEADAIRAVVGHPAFAGVRELAVVNRFGREDVETWLTSLAAATHVTKLRALGPATRFQLHNQFSDRFGLGEPALAAFCAAPHLRSLRSIDLGSCPLREVVDKDALAEYVAGATFARNLRRLNLSYCRLTAKGLRRVAAGAVFGRLRHLDLTDNPAGPDAPAAVFHSPHLTAVSSVGLNANHLRAFAASPMAKRVFRLAVRWADRNGWEYDPPEVPGWAELIAAAPPPARLTLKNHNPGAGAFRLMRRAGWLRRLHELDLSGDSQSGAYRSSGVFRGLFRPGVMPRLARLRLHEVGDPRLLEALAAWPGLSRLESLDLGDDYHGRFKPTNFAPEHPIGRLRRLEGVILSTDEDVDQFLALPGLENLTSLQVSFLGHYDRAIHRYTDAVVLTEAAADRLIRSERLARLTDLTLGFGYTRRVEFHIAPQFADPAVMPRLRTLHLYVSRDGTSADRPGIAGVQARFGLRLIAW